MKFIADFHIHSHYSIATSKNLIPEYLEYWARLKGINVIGTGDCVHPGWLKELKEKLLPIGNGLYILKDEYRLKESLSLNKKNIPHEIFFILTGEISNIYKKHNKVRKVHNVTVFPNFDAVEKVQARLDRIGNIRADGRPILGLDSKILLEMVLESSDFSFLIPAHIWTPWFSVLGSKSGFDSVLECYDDLTQHIFAVETGLSSDPAMNSVCSFLDQFRLVSNSDAHSPEKLGREANLFDTELSYQGIFNSLKNNKGFLGTIEFFPEEGKYHYDGHRKCNIKWDPLETIKHNGICSVCGKPVTKGVLYRVAELADKDELHDIETSRHFYSITQLPDLLAEILGQQSSNTKAVKKEFHKLIENLGSEFHILLTSSLDEIEAIGGEILAEGIKRLRSSKVIIDEGYDGEFGRIKVFQKDELDSFSGKGLFNVGGLPDVKTQNKSENSSTNQVSVKFDIREFKNLKQKYKNDLIPDNTADNFSDSSPISVSQDDQINGITHFEGPCMILAGPGSGKTRILTERIKFLIKEKNVPPENILAITFSNKAANEIRERIEQFSINNLHISTFHAFGLSILKDNYNACNRRDNFYIIEDEEKSEIIEKIIHDKRKINSAIKQIDMLKQGIKIEENIDALFNEYNNVLQKNNAFDLSDLIYLPVELFNKNHDILKCYNEKYPWILIDEFQDINAKQYELIKLLFNGNINPNLFIIGDPDQAIYGFRGSDIRFIEELKVDFAGIKILHLNKSYRCPEPVMKIAGQILKKDTILSGRPDDMKIHIHEMESDKSEADWIATQIEKMMGGVRSFSIDSGISDGESDMDSAGFSDFCVLCRSSFMFDAITEAFLNHGITYQLIDNNSFLQKEPLKSSIKYFRQIYYKQDAEEHELIPDEVKLKIQNMIQNKETIFNILETILLMNKAAEDDIIRIKNIAYNYNYRYDDFFRTLILRNGIDDFDDKSEAVSLMTLHGSKGLEFNTVFIPGCEEKIIPFELFGKKNQEELNEEERLFYVGVTRTKRNLFLTYAKSRKYKGRVYKQERSPFLNRLERDLLLLGKREVRKKDNDDNKQLDLF